LLAVREEILETLGHPIISVLGSQAARNLNLVAPSLGVIVIGYAAARHERQDLVNYFRRGAPTVPIVILLRRTEEPFPNVDYNCPTDNPPEWVKTVALALTGIQ